MYKKGNKMEIERKFTIKTLPPLSPYPFHQIEQAYLNTDPVIRIRKCDEEYYLTYKGEGLLSREEYNLPLNRASYNHLRSKADGIILCKKRYIIPYEKYKIELDIFSSPYENLMIAEVEFNSVEEAENFIPPTWFDQDVTYNPSYHNSNLSKG